MPPAQRRPQLARAVGRDMLVGTPNRTASAYAMSGATPVGVPSLLTHELGELLRSAGTYLRGGIGDALLLVGHGHDLGPGNIALPFVDDGSWHVGGPEQPSFAPIIRIRWYAARAGSTSMCWLARSYRPEGSASCADIAGGYADVVLYGCRSGGVCGSGGYGSNDVRSRQVMIGRRACRSRSIAMHSGSWRLERSRYTLSQCPTQSLQIPAAPSPGWRMSRHCRGRARRPCRRPGGHHLRRGSGWWLRSG